MIDAFFTFISTVWGQAAAVLVILLPFIVTWHAISTKKDVRSATGWIGLSWFVPILGSLFYFLLGVNRIHRKAIKVRRGKALNNSGNGFKSNQSLLNFFPQANQYMVAHSNLVDKVIGFPLTDGNKITPLIGGEEAFPEMLKVIEGAKKSIVLATYIFNHDEAGEKFAKALGGAALRGVKTYVLIDGIGEFYHLPRVSNILKKSGVKVRRFNRTFKPWRMAYFNLRNHRKILVVDGEIGFTGGMNIKEGNYSHVLGRRATRDLHFRLEGPVVHHLREIFAEDWFFSSGEKLKGDKWFPTLKKQETSGVVARGLPDGPDEDIDALNWTLISALAMAQKSVRIMTPYFLPERLLLNALNHAALRGVGVEILLPEKSNLPFVDWASWAQFKNIIEFGCHIHLSSAPFDHSKLMVVDDNWLLIGSTNWDARSLRLNFEFDVECFDRILADKMTNHFDGILSQSRRLNLSDIHARGFLRRFRDGLFWLLSPYL